MLEGRDMSMKATILSNEGDEMLEGAACDGVSLFTWFH